MIKQNYQRLQEKQISDIVNHPLFRNKKPTLLLHSCCAPCSSHVLENLSDLFDITVFYYNPNIYPQKEFEIRLKEEEKFIKTFPPAQRNKVKLYSLPYDNSEFYQALKIAENPELADEPERGERCKRCYHFRLLKTAKIAQKMKIDFFTTTLSISPYKDVLMINTEGYTIQTLLQSKNQKKFQSQYLYADFKKKNGFKRSIELSVEYNLYRQDYCGCVYSKRNTEKNLNIL